MIVLSAMCCTVLLHTTVKSGTDDSSSEANNEHVVSAVKMRYCTLGLFHQCMANEQCVVRRKPTVLRSRSGLCRCIPGFTRDPQTGVCINGRK